MIVITLYQDCHFEGVSALWCEAFPNDATWNRADIAIPEKIRFQPDLFFVATEADMVVGSVMAGYEGHRGWISRIAVLQSHRGGGVGREMMRHAEIQLASLGCIKVNLQVVSSNVRAVEFYNRSDYRIDERISMSKILLKP